MAKKYDILSPDGFSITPCGYFRSKKQAINALHAWIESYRQQGYYSQTCYNGYKRQIPLDSIVDYCELIEV